MAATMAPVTITYQKPGTKPPIYVAGTFTDPAWQLEEMDYFVDTNGEHVFKKEIQGVPGSKIHYKFRIGDGDWWVLNEDTPTVTDMAGNKNNELEIASPHGNPKGKGAENDEVVVPKAIGPGEGGLQPSINVAKEIQSLAGTHSGADTPTLAMNAAEVADSAALLNEEEPEAEISDEEAGRIGFRRLSATPINEVANTAAEVADSAQELDNTPEIIIHNYPREVYDFRDGEETDRPPLFAHECVGMQNVDEVVHQDHLEEDEYIQNESGEEMDLDNIDLNDPTLERFPSNREGIINTVRKLETGLGEDRVAFDGAPISPVIGAYRPGMEDITGDPFLSSPIVASPIIPRPSRHLEVPRSPHGSISSNHSSPLSLHAIDEGDESGGTDEDDSVAPILRSPSQPRTGFRAPKRPSSDEDEGIAMKDSGSYNISAQENGSSGSKKAESPRDIISRALQEESPDIEASIREAEPHHSLTTPESSPDRHNKPESPEIVVQSAEGDEGHNAEIDQRQDGLAKPGTNDANTGNDVDVGTSTAVEASENSQVRKRSDPAGRSGTPASNHSVSLHPNREGGWFKNFFRLLFVDWIGGFISRLCGRRRQTLLTAGAAAVFMGFSWWKIYGDGSLKPHSNA